MNLYFNRKQQTKIPLQNEAEGLNSVSKRLGFPTKVLMKLSQMSEAFLYVFWTSFAQRKTLKHILPFYAIGFHNVSDKVCLTARHIFLQYLPYMEVNGRFAMFGISFASCS